jgi:hypothetical protein
LLSSPIEGAIDGAPQTECRRDGLLLGVGVISLFRLSQNLFDLAQNVRLVDVVGPAGGGAAWGAAIFGTIFSLVSRSRN